MIDQTKAWRPNNHPFSSASPSALDPATVREVRPTAAPALIVWGSADKLLPAAQAKVWAGLIPGARVVRFKGVGHMPFHEDRAAVERVGKFLSA